jgi:hypothetical protein
MAELGAFFGNPNLQRQGARARALAEKRDVNTLLDPRTYAVTQGLLGTRPDEMGVSVLNPDYQKMREVADPAFAIGSLLQIAPMAKALNAPAAAIGKALDPAVGRFVTKTLEGGGLPAEMLQAMGTNTRSNIFIGPWSKAFNRDAAIDAVTLEKQGVSKQEIWKQTGTVRGPDGVLRQEISDMASSIKGDKPFEDVIMGACQKGAADTGNQIYRTTVEDVFMHNRLKDAYPELMKIETRMMPKGESSSVRGSLSRDLMNNEQIVNLRKNLSPEDARSTMLHELQHAVQEKSGMAVGGNTDAMTQMIAQAKDRKFLIENMDEYRQASKLNNDLWDKFFTENASIPDLKAAEQELFKKYPILQEHSEAADTVKMLGDDPYEAYKRLIGEAEARLVQTRRNLSTSERKDFFPFEFQDERLNPYGLDVPLESLINMDSQGRLVEKGLLGY